MMTYVDIAERRYGHRRKTNRNYQIIHSGGDLIVDTKKDARRWRKELTGMGWKVQELREYNGLMSQNKKVKWW